MDRYNKKNKTPDFDQLNDRLIANASESPTIQIKTNLDTKNISEENPYFKNNEKLSTKEKQQLHDFFSQD